jgi:integrase
MSTRVKNVAPGIWLTDTNRYLARVQPGGRDSKPISQTFDTIAQAKGWQEDIRTDYRRGDFIDPQGPKTLFKVWAEHVRTTRIHREGTAKAWEKALRLHILPYFGNMAVGSIRKSHVDRWVKETSRVLKPRSLSTTFGYLSAIMAEAVQEPLIKKDPTQGVDLPKPDQETISPLTVEHIRDLESALPEQYRLAVTIAAGTGLRIGEVLGLTLGESIATIQPREVHVVQQLQYAKGHGRYLGPPKTDASRRDVPLPKVVAAALAEYLARHPAQEIEVPVTDGRGGWWTETRRFIFTNGHGQVVSAAYFGDRILNPAVVRAGLPTGSTFHDLRHHFASLLIFSGRSVKAVQSYLGHTTSQVTLDVYGHLWPEEEDLARHAVDDAWSAHSGARSVLVVSQMTP